MVLHSSYNLILTARMCPRQIVGRLPKITRVDFPEPFAFICQAIADVIDGALEQIPMIACSFGGGFTRRLAFKVSVTPVLILVIVVVHKIRIWHLVNRKMPISSTAKITTSWRVKLHRAMHRGHMIHTSAGCTFAVYIYLLYPSTSAMIFESF
jgi:hypothetical protein